MNIVLATALVVVVVRCNCSYSGLNVQGIGKFGCALRVCVFFVCTARSSHKQINLQIGQWQNKNPQESHNKNAGGLRSGVR